MSDLLTAVQHVPVHIVGIVRGHELDTPAVLSLDDDTLVLVWSAATPWRLSLDTIDGIGVTTTQPSRTPLSKGDAVTHMSVYLESGDVLDIAGDDTLRQIATLASDRACTMPELTRGLRALGSLRGSPGAAHDAWFAPFMAARRSAEGVSDPLRQVELIDATRMARSLQLMIAELAAIRAPTDAPMQRAIEAVLEEEAEPLSAAITRMGIAADALRGSATDTRLLDWRRWVETLRLVFVAADEAWERCAPVLQRD